MISRLKPKSGYDWACFCGSVVISGVLVSLIASANYSSRYSVGFDLLGMILFLVVALIGIALWFMTWRWRMITLLMLSVTYIGSFTALSAAGDYYWSQSGLKRYKHGFAMTDCLIWHPKGLYWEPFVNIYGKSTYRGTVLGYFYMPLLQCDRHWIHRTRRFPEDFPFD